MIVAISAVVVVLAGAAIGHLLLESWVVPRTQALLLLGGAGLFLIFGHFFIFMAYRVGPTGIVAPFYYCFTVWAVISGLVVFGHLPNPLADLRHPAGRGERAGNRAARRAQAAAGAGGVKRLRPA